MTLRGNNRIPFWAIMFILRSLTRSDGKINKSPDDRRIGHLFELTQNHLRSSSVSTVPSFSGRHKKESNRSRCLVRGNRGSVADEVCF